MSSLSRKKSPLSLITLALATAAIGTACSAGETSYDPVSDTWQPLTDSGIHLKAVTAGTYVGAQDGGGSTVKATATQARGWESFTFDDINGGALESGDSVFIQAQNGQYLMAQNGGGSTLSAVSNNRQSWETFRVMKAAGTGAIKNGDVIGIQSSSGNWVRAVNGGGSSIDVKGARMQGWEQFAITGISTANQPNQPGDPTCSNGIASGEACCAASCGSCGGSGCGDRPGGSAACCSGPVKSSGASCSENQPPCVMENATDPGEPTGLVWRTATLTNYTSYPDPGSDECINYNGCTWAGYFAALDGKQPESWVRANNIAAVHGKDFEKYKLKTLRLRQGSRQIDVKVYDMCADSDCNGCCTRNAQPSGNLIDVEKYTMQRFGTGSGQVEWACLDCN